MNKESKPDSRSTDITHMKALERIGSVSIPVALCLFGAAGSAARQHVRTCKHQYPMALITGKMRTGISADYPMFDKLIRQEKMSVPGKNRISGSDCITRKTSDVIFASDCSRYAA